jgi:hypothetical protein
MGFMVQSLVGMTEINFAHRTSMTVPVMEFREGCSDH